MSKNKNVFVFFNVLIVTMDDISLNLVSEDVSSSIPKQKKVQGDRKSRVKQRKLERQKNVQERNFGTKVDKSAESNRKRKSNNGEEVVIKKSKGIISSLFKKNPEIPHISSSEVETVSEQVFTGKTFKDLKIHPHLISNLEEKQGFSEMTEIQRRAIPVIMGWKDALIKSQTGSGKTLSYAVPIVQGLQSKKSKVQRSDGPYALVIVPTRELAIQSYDTFVKLLRTFIWIVPGCLMGGEKKKAEKARLRKGVNILVTTPGRLIDHLNTTTALTLRRIQWLVIDEADRLLELGYEKDISQILECLKKQCPDPPQSILLSATLSEGVERLSSVSLNEPVRVGAGGEDQNMKNIESNASVQSSGVLFQSSDVTADGSFVLPSQLKQQFIVVPCKLRLMTLGALILWKCQFSKPSSKMIVFMSTQDSVEFHFQLFSSLFGPKSKKDREIDRLQALAMGGIGADLHKIEDVGDSDDEDEDEEDGISGNPKKFKIFQLHGEMKQENRSKTFLEFSQINSGVLLCTDVAARGLNLQNVDCIVQYTCPGSAVDYVHRVGRTARAGGQGDSILFLMPSETGYIHALNSHKISMSQLKPTSITCHLLTHLDDLPRCDDAESRRERPQTQEEAATYLQDRFEDAVRTDKDLKALAGRGFQSFVRAYAAYSKEVKAYLRYSDLHLGHVAKSFALREAPGKVSGKVVKREKKVKEKPIKRPLSFKQATLSEFSSGFDKDNKLMNTKSKSDVNRHQKKKKKKILKR